MDWAHLDVWWGDERFLPTGDAERNETQARTALLDHVPVDPDRVHPMPASDSPNVSGDRCRSGALRRHASGVGIDPKNHAGVPAFDVLLLGVGPDAHVASLFPDQPALYESRPVVAVHGAPKPPPIRLTLTLPAIRAAEEVWLVAAGEKAAAVRLALSGGGEVQVPAPLGHADATALCGCWIGQRRPRSPRAGAHRCSQDRRSRVDYGWRALRSPFQRLFQNGRAVGVASAFLHVGEMSLVGLVARSGHGFNGSRLAATRIAGSPSTPGSPHQRRSWALFRGLGRNRT